MNNKRRWKTVGEISSPYLEPGESVRRFAFAQTFNPLWNFVVVPVYVILGPMRLSLRLFIVIGVGLIVIVLGLTVFNRTGRIVAITNRRVLVWATGGSIGRGHEFLRELPRGTMIGPASGNWWKSFDTLGERLYLVPRGWGEKEQTGEEN